MSDEVNHPKHYAPCFSPIDLECVAISRQLPFDLGNAFKYIWRAGNKGEGYKPIQDLDKTLWYIQDWKNYPWEYAGQKYTANAIFNLIPKDVPAGLSRWRYCALSSLLNEDYTVTVDAVDRMKEHIQGLAGESLEESGTNYRVKDFKDPVYCDDIAYALVNEEHSVVEPENILKDPEQAKKVEEALKVVREYANFLETVVES